MSTDIYRQPKSPLRTLDIFPDRFTRPMPRRVSRRRKRPFAFTGLLQNFRAQRLRQPAAPRLSGFLLTNRKVLFNLTFGQRNNVPDAQPRVQHDLAHKTICRHKRGKNVFQCFIYQISRFQYIVLHNLQIVNSTLYFVAAYSCKPLCDMLRKISALLPGSISQSRRDSCSELMRISRLPADRYADRAQRFAASCKQRRDSALNRCPPKQR